MVSVYEVFLRGRVVYTQLFADFLHVVSTHAVTNVAVGILQDGDVE